MNLEIKSAAKMKELGSKLASYVQPGQCWYFDGALGTGKTTLIQGILAELGVEESVLSPTFSIIETHCVRDDSMQIIHLDLYRIESPEELVHTGLDEYWHDECSWFIEWPALGGTMIPEADVSVNLTHQESSRRVKIHGLDDFEG